MMRSLRTSGNARWTWSPTPAPSPYAAHPPCPSSWLRPANVSAEVTAMRPVISTTGRTIAGHCRTYLGRCASAACVAIVLLAGGVAHAESRILYTRQTNPLPPGLPPGADSWDQKQTWANTVCGGEFPSGSQLEWAPILDPGQELETTVVAVSGMVAYNPQPDESGFCQGKQGTICPGEPVLCTDDSICDACGGSCDLAQGPWCSGGTCREVSPIPCVSDAQCKGACLGGDGTCVALGRSRDDVQMTHPFGFDYDVAIAPDQDYWQLLARGNQERTHLDSQGLTPSGCLMPNPTDQTAIGGFEDIVYPYLHATTPQAGEPTVGWCSPDFKCRCKANANCPDGGVCQGAVHGLGFDPNLPGTLGMEIDHDLIPESYLPHDGDRVAVFGRWIVDCGHGDNDQGVSGFHTEIHPPLLVASGRQT